MRSVVWWAPSGPGHHSQYLEAALSERPAECEVHVPAALASRIRDKKVRILPSIAAADVRSSVAFAESIGADSVVVGESNHRTLRHLLSRRVRRSSIPIVVVDVHSTFEYLSVESPLRLGLRGFAGAIGNWVMHEVIVRSGPRTFTCLLPGPVRVGTARLRTSAFPFRDLLQDVEVPVSSWALHPAPRLVMAGVLGPRKGLELLAEALSGEHAQFFRGQMHVVVAGEVRPRYAAAATAAVRRISDAGVEVTAVFRELTTEEFGFLVGNAEVLCLPYRRHKGGSGILAAQANSGDTRAVVSDFGYLGQLARTAGARVFPDGDASALAKAVLDALAGAGVLDHSVLRACLATNAEFGKRIWAVLSVAQNRQRPLATR